MVNIGKRNNMTKELFIKCIEEIRKQQKKEIKLCKDLEVLVDGHFVCHFNEGILFSLVEVLAEAFDDKEKWID